MDEKKKKNWRRAIAAIAAALSAVVLALGFNNAAEIATVIDIAAGVLVGIF